MVVVGGGGGGGGGGRVEHEEVHRKQTSPFISQENTSKSFSVN